MGFIQGEGRTQGTLFPVILDELIPQDHVCRVIDAFVDRLDMAGLGFEHADPADTGRPGYDPRVCSNSICMVICSRSARRGGWRMNVDATWK
jgi:transposase